MKPKIISKKIEYKCNWLTVESFRLKLPTGKFVKWEVPKMADFVDIVPIDQKGNVYLVKEWRIAWKRDFYQIPAGSIKGNSNNEKVILNEARRELYEETGLVAKKWEKILTAPLSSRWKVKGNIYLVRDLTKKRQEPDNDEIIKVVKMPFAKAFKLLFSGKVLTSAYTLLAMALVKEKLRL